MASTTSNSGSDSKYEAFKKSHLQIITYQVRLESVEARIVVHQKNEAIYEEDIALLKIDVQLRDNFIKELKNQLESTLKEKDDLKLKLEKFETSSNNLAKLIGSQLYANNTTGLGYCNHANGCKANDSQSVSDEEDSLVNDRFKKRLDDSVYKCTVTKSISNESKVETNVTKSYTHSIEKPKTDRPSAPIIEEWESNSDNDNTISPIKSQEAGKGVKSKKSTHKNSKGCSKMADQEELIPPLKKLVWVRRMHPNRGGKMIQMKNLMLLMRNNNNKLMLNIFKKMKYWHRDVEKVIDVVKSFGRNSNEKRANSSRTRLEWRECLDVRWKCMCWLRLYIGIRKLYAQVLGLGGKIEAKVLWFYLVTKMGDGAACEDVMKPTSVSVKRLPFTNRNSNEAQTSVQNLRTFAILAITNSSDVKSG
uniref:Uncharacterized protein n=1 Tax=Tanacetum cinerariifolium TaxID=118510 RepID=A0A6L2KBM3_TANCI|nr:hypothetical protein [Tanacetum cinerariifolium]